jgi:hypothetical protein
MEAHGFAAHCMYWHTEAMVWRSMAWRKTAWPSLELHGKSEMAWHHLAMGMLGVVWQHIA